VVPEIDVDLSLPPARRWESLAPWRASARALMQFYVRDLGGLGPFASILTEYRDAAVDAEYVEEMRGVARIVGAPEEEVALANLYYDAMKLVLSSSGLACTGFAIDAPEGPLHARNLDWSTADGLLASETVIVNFRRGSSGAPAYRIVGWPGFTGCFTGVAPGRFAVSLNAVISDDPPEIAPPIAFVLRRALEEAPTFDAAVTRLQEAPIASDALLLVTGTKPGEAVVIERAPTRAALRFASRGALVVTNDYRKLASSPTEVSGSSLVATSCDRFDRASALLRSGPTTMAESLPILKDRAVRMAITVQHVAMCAATGEVRVELPA
jgi:hypothetical protein